MWIVRTIGDCPSCGGKECYGNVAVRSDHVLRFCRACRSEFHYPLPPVRKRVLYLDQFFFSHAFRGEPQFLEAAERVRRAAHLQLLVAPYSPVHEDETYQWRGHDGMTREQLMDFIKTAARGAVFEHDYAVERTQTLKAFDSFLADADPAYVLERTDAIQRPIDQWDDYFFVDLEGYWRDVELKRRLKTETVSDLVDVFDSWQSSTATFDQDVALEYADAGRLYFDLLRTKLTRLDQGDEFANLDSPIRVRTIEAMVGRLPQDTPVEESLMACARYFQSEHFKQVPFEWLSARMFATLKAMVRRGAYADRSKAKRRLAGIMEDMNHISHYAPYCDAFVMDVPMAELVRQPTVDLQARYGVRIFSRTNWSDFMAWLTDLESGMSDEHRESVAEAYPK